VYVLAGGPWVVERSAKAQAADLSTLLARCRSRGSLCITSNKASKDWPEMLAGITAAIPDRLLHACHVLDIR
jgi:DNA replication protein DnaC